MGAGGSDRMRRPPGGAAAVLRRSPRAARDSRAGGVSATPTPSCSRAGSPTRRTPRPHRRAAARREARPARSGVAQRRGGVPGALQRERRRALRRARNAAVGPGAARHAAAHRVLRHLHDPGQRDRRVDGGVRRRADEEGGIPEVPDPGLGLGARGSGTTEAPSRTGASSPEPPNPPACRSARAASPEPRFWTTSPRCARSSCAATASCSRTAGRFPI